MGNLLDYDALVGMLDTAQSFFGRADELGFETSADLLSACAGGDA